MELASGIDPLFRGPQPRVLPLNYASMVVRCAMTNDPVILAYLAGLFDGEGNAYVATYKATKNGHSYYRPVLRITNTHRPVLKWAQCQIGFGNVTVQYKQRPNRLECFKYEVTNAKAVELMRTLRPFLIIKAAHIDKLLASRLNGRANGPGERTRTSADTPYESAALPLSYTG